MKRGKMNNSFIVGFWSAVFVVLSWLSLFKVIRLFVPALKGSDRFVDGWVVCHSILALLVFVTYPWWQGSHFAVLAVAYALVRVFEVVVYQLNVVLFDERRNRMRGKPYAVSSYRRSVLLLGHNYLEVVLWFGAVYRQMEGCFSASGATSPSTLAWLKYSFVMMTCFGQTAIAPRNLSGDVITFAQSASGLILAILVVARFVSWLPAPRSEDKYEQAVEQALLPGSGATLGVPGDADR